MTIEEIVPSEVRKAITAVASTEDWSFTNLVRLSGLDPKEDFRFLDLGGFDLRGVDLRGFDLTGADLRGCLKDGSTKIDATTILDGAQIEWIEVQKDSIVEKMAEVERSRTSRERRKTLTELVSEYQSPDHTRRYLRNLMDQTRSVEAFFDYLDFFQPKTDEDVIAIANGLRHFSNSSVRTPGKTRRYLNPSTTSYRILIDRIAGSSNEVVSDMYNNYLKKLSEIGRETRNPNRYTADEDYMLLKEAINESSGQRSLQL